MNRKKSITVYTDGSCNPLRRTGSWTAIMLLDDQKLVLKGIEPDTTHQRMELTAVLKALEYLELKQLLAQPIQLYSDSQYVINLQKRRTKLQGKNFLTKKNQPIRNLDLVTSILNYIDKTKIEFIKVEAHQKVRSAENLNRDVDKFARGMIREHLRTLLI